jgi:hypothetical protein
MTPGLTVPLKAGRGAVVLGMPEPYTVEMNLTGADSNWQRIMSENQVTLQGFRFTFQHIPLTFGSQHLPQHARISRLGALDYFFSEPIVLRSGRSVTISKLASSGLWDAENTTLTVAYPNVSTTPEPGAQRPKPGPTVLQGLDPAIDGAHLEVNCLQSCNSLRVKFGWEDLDPHVPHTYAITLNGDPHVIESEMFNIPFYGRSFRFHVVPLGVWQYMQLDFKPYGVLIDDADFRRQIWIADFRENQLVSWTSDGVLSRPEVSSRFLGPTAMARADDGFMYVADGPARQIFQVKYDEDVAVFAGRLDEICDPYGPCGDGADSSSRATFGYIEALEVTDEGLLVVDSGSSRIRFLPTEEAIRISRAEGRGTPRVATVAGSGWVCDPEFRRSCRNGPALETRIAPVAVAAGRRGRVIYFAEPTLHQVRMVFKGEPGNAHVR